MKTYLGFDFGGTKLLVGEVDEKGSVLACKRYETGCVTQQQAVERLLACAVDYRENVGLKGEVQAAGVGIVGVSNNRTGEWISMNHIVSGPPIPLADILSEELQIPVALDNDVRSATTAEWILGHGRNTENFIYINVGTGLAAGFVVNGTLIRGANNNSGEVGHSVVDIKSEQACICGRNGCVENVVSGSGFAKQALQYGLTEVINAENSNSADAMRLYKLAEEGDERAVCIIEQAADTLAALIMNLVRVTDPDTVILGGGIVNGGWLLDKVQKRLNPSTMRGVTKGIVVSQFEPAYAGLIGAASLGMVLCEKKVK